MSTYIVEVDSTFRDLTTYQTQTDFAVSFLENPTQDYQVLGLPYSFQTGTTNFFEQLSIDPDYQNSDLKVINGNLQEIKRNGLDFYLSGIAFDQTSIQQSQTGFAITYKDQLLVRLVGIQNTSPYLCKLTRQVNNSYVFDWCIYAIGQISTSSSDPLYLNYSLPVSINCTVERSERGGIFWFWDFNYKSFVVNKITESGGIFSLTQIYSISNISPIQEAFCNIIFAFDENGNNYLSNNRPWGYHLLTSDFKLSSIQSNGNLGIVLDRAENLYITTNMDGTDPYIYFLSQTSQPTITNGFRFNTTSTFVTYRYETGTTGSYTGASTGAGTFKEYFVSISNTNDISNIDPTMIITDVIPTELYNLRWRAVINLSVYLPTSTISPLYYYTNIGNFLYIVGIPGDFNFNIANTYSALIFKVDVIKGTTTLVGQSLALFNCCNISGVTIGNTIYFSVRSNSQRVYMYTFDTVTNTLTNTTSLLLTSTTTYYASCTCYQVGVDTLVVISPDSDNLTSLNTLQRTNTLSIMTYTISTSTLSLVNTANKIYPLVSPLQRYLSYKNNRVFYFIYYSYPTVFDIYDVTTPSSSYLIYSTNIQCNNLTPYTSYDSFGNIHYLLNISQYGNAISVYCLDDMENIYPITDNISSDKQFGLQSFNYSRINKMAGGSTVFTPYGYAYAWNENQGGTINASIQRLRWIHYPTLRFNSIHYYLNTSVNYFLNISTFYTQMKLVYNNNIQYGFLGSRNGIQQFTISSLYTTTLTNVLSFSTPLSSIPIFFQILPYQSSLYIIIGNSQTLYVYLTDFLFQSWTLLSTITRTGDSTTDIRAVTLFYTNFSSSPGIFFVVSQSNYLHRKFQIITSTVSLITSSTIILNGIYGSNISYISSINTYYLILSGLRQYTLVNVTNPENLSVGPTTDAAETSRIGSPNILFELLSNTAGKITNNIFTFGYWGTQPFNSAFISTNSTINPVGTKGGNVGSVVSSYNYNQNAPTYTGYYTNQSTYWVDNLTETSYIAVNNNGGTGTNDFITIINTTNVLNVQINNSSKIAVPGNVLQMSNIQSGLQTVLVALVKPVSTGPSGSFTGPNRLWYYDVSNVENAVNYQNLTPITTVYTNIKSDCGAGIIHKIGSFGNPEWLDVIGGELDDTDQSANNICISGLTTDNQSNLYITGSWNRKINCYQSTSTGSLQNYPNNQFIQNDLNNQAFIAKLQFTNGEWKWIEPLIGTGNTFMKNISYSSIQNMIASCFYFSSINLTLYEPQESISNPTGNSLFTSFGQPIAFFFNSSASNSVVLANDINGNFLWRNVLFSNIYSSKINLFNIHIDESDVNDSRVLVCGTSNSTAIRGSDPNLRNIQYLYPTIDPITQVASITYQFSLTGGYLASSYQVMPTGSITNNQLIVGYSDINVLWTVNQTFPTFIYNTANFYNKDSTLGQQKTTIANTTNTFLSEYKYNSITTESNGFNYSTVYIYNITGTSQSLSGSFENSSLYILGAESDPILNQNFSVRNATYNTGTNVFQITLNQQILVNEIDRMFTTINNITGSNEYYAGNLSTTPLYDIGKYISITGNSITFDYLSTHLPGTLDLSKEYFFVIPQQTGATGSNQTYNDSIPITTISYNSSTEQYTFTINNIDDIRIPSPSGPYYGPYLYLAQKNYSAFYSLQWYPGSRVYPQTYLVGLYDLIIPNRPIRNSRYPGLRTITDFPYIYLIIYNSDQNDNFDPSVVNSVYDNNVNVPRFALFQIPTTTFNPVNGGNYFSASSTATPKIRFTPGYYNLHFKLTDDDGNVILFDNTPYKDSDSIFSGSVIPERLLNITARLAFKRG